MSDDHILQFCKGHLVMWEVGRISNTSKPKRTQQVPPPFCWVLFNGVAIAHSILSSPGDGTSSQHTSHDLPISVITFSFPCLATAVAQTHNAFKDGVQENIHRVTPKGLKIILQKGGGIYVDKRKESQRTSCSSCFFQQAVKSKGTKQTKPFWD